MTIRYVHAKNGSSTGAFDSIKQPARKISDALGIAAPGDVIQILDAETYQEDELVIDKALTVTSSYLAQNPAADPTDPTFDPKLLPVIVPKAGAVHRVLRVEGNPATRASFGPVVISGIRIAKGHSRHTSSDPALGAGGGIAVIDADRVTVERCIISGNRTESAAIGGWPEPDRLAFRAALVDLVGEIVSPTAEVTINTVIRAANVVIASVGRGTPLSPFSRATVLLELGKAFDGRIVSGRANSWLAGQAFGGGVAAVWASPTLRRCLVRDNQADGRGAGIGVVGYGWPTLDNCWVDGNHSGNTGRRDGGGIGCEVSLPSKMPRDLSEIDLVRFLTAKLVALKSSLSSPSMPSLMDVVSWTWWLINPTTPSPPVRGIKALVLEAIHGRWGSMADSALYFAVTSALSRNASDAWELKDLEAARTNEVKIQSCRITGNRARDDGGGVYASVLSRITMKQCKVAGNSAISGMGGGVRLSMGSGGQLQDCEFTGNSSSDRGGALAARNADLSLQNVHIGAALSGSVPTADSNVSADAPGGGIAYECMSEGPLAGVKNLWHAILQEVFKVKRVTVNISNSCVIQGNGAGFSAAHTPVPKPKAAKGGGLFILRGDFVDAPTLELTVKSVKSVVRNNQALTRGYTSKVDDSSIPASDQVALQDMNGHKEWTDLSFGPLLSGGDLKFRG